MKSRNREINIFNMSLLDILCGALGAFCFMMIVLLPYYKPGKPDDAKRQQQMEKSVKELEDFKKKITDPKLAQELEDLIKKLREQIKELEGRVNSLTQENKQLADQNQQLQKDKDALAQKNKELEDKNKQLADQVQQLDDKNKSLQKDNDRLSMRMPGTIVTFCHGSMPEGQTGVLDLFLWSPNPNVGGQTQPLFNPTVPMNKSFFDGDVEVPMDSPVPMTLFLYRDVAFGSKLKVYVKLCVIDIHGKDPIKMLPITAPMKVTTMLTSGSPNTLLSLPQVELTPEHPWMLLGFLDTDKDRKQVFTPATPAEREEEWRKLDKPRAAKP